jgi:hypothetical protein
MNVPVLPHGSLADALIVEVPRRPPDTSAMEKSPATNLNESERITLPTLKENEVLEGISGDGHSQE